MSGCNQLYIAAYVDGEFNDDEEKVEIEAHLQGCPACQRQVQELCAYKVTVRALASAHKPAAPKALHQRVRVILDAEDQKNPPPALPPAPVKKGPAWLTRRAAALALLGVLLMPGVLQYLSHASAFIEDSIAKHQRNLPLEVQGDPRMVRSWFQGKVPFAVRPPPLDPSAVALRGGRLVSLANREAAYLIYERPQPPIQQPPRMVEMAEGRISVFIFESPDDREPELGGLARRRVIGSHEVFLDGSRGYNVVAFRSRGLGYLITSDLDERELLSLLASALSNP